MGNHFFPRTHSRRRPAGAARVRALPLFPTPPPRRWPPRAMTRAGANAETRSNAEQETQQLWFCKSKLSQKRRKEFATTLSRTRAAPTARRRRARTGPPPTRAGANAETRSNAEQETQQRRCCKSKLSQLLLKRIHSHSRPPPPSKTSKTCLDSLKGCNSFFFAKTPSAVIG